jgi:hypothetical protein
MEITDPTPEEVAAARRRGAQAALAVLLTFEREQTQRSMDAQRGPTLEELKAEREALIEQMTPPAEWCEDLFRLEDPREG